MGKHPRFAPRTMLEAKKAPGFKGVFVEYFRIKNWEKFQHPDAVRGGRMPWIKFYTSILHDHTLSKLSPSEFGMWARLALIVGEIGNKVPLDHPWLRARLAPVKFKKAFNLQFMWDLGLIEKWDASLDKDKDKTKTKTASAARKQTEPSPKFSPRFTPKKTAAMQRLENNMRVAQQFMEPEDEQS